MIAVLQISDTHFGTEQQPVLRALEELNRVTQPAAIVLSGDITQRARRSQFAAARRYIDRLAAPRLITIPGNHDIPLFNLFARIFHPYANYTREFGVNLEPQLETDALLIIGVNTTRPARHKDGEVSQAQVDRVSAALRRASPEQLRIVVTHQPVHVTRESDTVNLLHGREQAVRSWALAGADMIMGGHIHLPYVRPLADQFPDLPRRLWSVQAGTAVSHRVRDDAPNSVNVVRYQPGAARVERWSFDAETATFQLGTTHELALDR